MVHAASKVTWSGAFIAWLANAPRAILPAVQGWNGHFIGYLCRTTGHDDLDLVKDIQNWFPMIGQLPAYGISSRPKSKVDRPGHSVIEVWNERYINNANLIKSFAEGPDGEVIKDALSKKLSLAQ